MMKRMFGRRVVVFAAAPVGELVGFVACVDAGTPCASAAEPPKRNIANAAKTRINA